MKLLTLRAKSYRSLRDTEMALTDMNVFIGANASGKSSILDALRFLSEGVRARDFRPPAFARGGVLHLAWKGEDAVGSSSPYAWSTKDASTSGRCVW